MGIDSKEPEDNSWYLLATLFGVPVNMQDERRDKNRRAWNRYFAANLDDETRARLVKEKGHYKEELEPFSPEELQGVEEAFAKRKGTPKNVALPASNIRIDFSNVQFNRKIDFSHHIFIECLFKEANFFDRADFRDATFLEGANFASVRFRDEAYFIRATFFRQADFKEKAIFSADAYFLNANFIGYSNFAGATFFGLFDLREAVFSSGVDLGGATFAKDGTFDDVRFSREVSFARATFCKSVSFVNAKMQGETSFEDATFKTKAPKFFGAKLHQGTVCRGIRLWPVPKKTDDPGPFIDAYACLKLEMDRLKKHEDELDFFALELQSRRVLLGPWGWPIWVYGLFSDYGRSYWRPLGALCVVAALGAAAFWYFDVRPFGEALGLSAANTLNVFGFRRDFSLAIDTPLAWLKVLAAVQTILGTILLFLFGLGIRNKFRMK